MLEKYNWEISIGANGKSYPVFQATTCNHHGEHFTQQRSCAEPLLTRHPALPLVASNTWSPGLSAGINTTIQQLRRGWTSASVLAVGHGLARVGSAVPNSTHSELETMFQISRFLIHQWPSGQWKSFPIFRLKAPGFLSVNNHQRSVVNTSAFSKFSATKKKNVTLGPRGPRYLSVANQLFTAWWPGNGKTCCCK